ncbi:MAG: hypothetical protein KGL39_44055 [Patescibacteria group bacterium]|nr:hypothetical protein [Patescibacteria group bacterium]
MPKSCLGGRRMTRPATYGDDCLICGAKSPPGHVIVRSENGKHIEGRVCSSHTLFEVIADKSDRFMVEITMDNGSGIVDTIERVHARHGLKTPALPPLKGQRA